MLGSATKIDSPAVAAGDLRVRWFFCARGAAERSWDWQRFGPPAVEQLAPVRMPRSSASNRHIPVTAYSTTNGGVLHLESGLEHDLVRRLDRNAEIVSVVSQPLRLSWVAPDPLSHTPDLLTLHQNNTVTVWDVRALEEQDADFRNKSAVTRDACAAVRWHYEVFTGLGETERLNLLWLHGFRRRPDFADRHEETAIRATRNRKATIGSLFAHDDGTGELKAVVWHLVWTGVLSVDITVPWNLDTAIAARGGVRND